MPNFKISNVSKAAINYFRKHGDLPGPKPREADSFVRGQVHSGKNQFADIVDIDESGADLLPGEGIVQDEVTTSGTIASSYQRTSIYSGTPENGSLSITRLYAKGETFDSTKIEHMNHEEFRFQEGSMEALELDDFGNGFTARIYKLTDA